MLTGEISLDMACNKRQLQGSVLTSDLFLNIGCNKCQVQAGKQKLGIRGIQDSRQFAFG